MSGNGSQEARHVCSEGAAMGSAACINGRGSQGFPRIDDSVRDAAKVTDFADR